MLASEIAIVLRLADAAGTSRWCLKIDPDYGRPDLHPGRPWPEIGEGDTVVSDDGTIYEVERMALIGGTRGEPVGELVPACREAIERLAGRPFGEYLAAVPR